MSRTQPTLDDLRAWLRALPDVLLFVDPELGTIEDLNRIGPVWGWSRYELLGRAVSELFDTVDAAEPVQTFVRSKEGRRLPVELRVAADRPGQRLLIVREIGDRQATEAELRRLDGELVEANRFLGAVVENIPDMIFVKRASDHMFIRFNRAGEELLGWSRTELLGKTDHDFYPKEEADFFHLKDRETFERRELVDVPEEPITTRHQGRRWLHTKKVPVYDDDGRPLYLLGISEDITERKAALDRAHALERELAAVVTHAHDAVISWDGDGRVASFNPAAEALYGCTARQAIGAPLVRFVPEGVREALDAICARVLDGERLPAAVVPRVRADGFEIEVEERVFRVPGADGEARLASIGRDAGEMARLRRATELLVAIDRHRQEAPGDGMRRILEAVEAAAADPVATVLLLGETGVGKSWIARRIHARSPRCSKPFFEVNCAGLGPQLVESELFGHERGSFTGAVEQKRGIVEAADGGTLFLDEVGELPLAVQAQLLTFLDARSFRRLGGTRALTADVRIFAATNRDLKAAVASHAFRADLFYRLNVFPIEIPPIRERRSEIGELAETILRDLARRAGRERIELTGAALAALLAYDWPGNVRELRNALERAVILARGAPIAAEHLPLDTSRTLPSSMRLEDVERNHLLAVLERVGGNRTKAAEVLGISRSTLKRKLAELKVAQ